MERPTSSTEELTLLERARYDDEHAWEELVARHQQAVFRLAYLILQNREDAFDVAQDAFVRAYMKLDQHDGSRPLRPWLLAITANLARNKRRSVGRYWHAVGRFLQGKRKEDLVAAPPGDGVEAAILWQAVRRLPYTAQEIIYLRYFLELSVEETAETLQIAPGTVKSRAYRALQKLRAIIDKEYPELADERIIH